ncbi:hypothetical protein PYCCODRAFT_59646 [Trametes coccinea BRFM310]|uniref:Uncharacterized protein n=1 Tax=Trametes coccinea (strain BRFM310) TaxID=1353009 RepID=A0A1Y2IVL3_TRAC3|nr:hypothetical protein PYCCODRAFT_59646 [Trametes coccinea BRFM310]
MPLSRSVSARDPLNLSSAVGRLPHYPDTGAMLEVRHVPDVCHLARDISLVVKLYLDIARSSRSHRAFDDEVMELASVPGGKSYRWVVGSLPYGNDGCVQHRPAEPPPISSLPDHASPADRGATSRWAVGTALRFPRLTIEADAAHAVLPVISQFWDAAQSGCGG